MCGTWWVWLLIGALICFDVLALWAACARAGMDEDDHE